MNWGRAKDFCLLFLILLNIFLFVMINLFDSKYRLSHQRIYTINKLLERNNIKSCSITRSYSPKKYLSLVDYELSPGLLKKFLFDDDMNTKYKLFLYKNGFICKLAPKQKKYFADSHQQSKELCYSAVKKIMDPTSNFILDHVKINNNPNKKKYIYRQQYHDFVILDNFISFTFENNFLCEIKCEYRKPNNFFGMPCEVQAPDLVLYDFIKNENVIRNNARIINKFDIAYRSRKSDSAYAVPVYRFIYNNNLQIDFEAY